MATESNPKPYMWMAPAMALGRLRPGLRAAAAADSARLRELPAWYGRLALPLVAIAVPLLLSILHALRPIGDYGTVYADPSAWTFLIWTTFTESVSFIAIVAAIGMASPAAGVLVALVYGATDLPAAFITGDMRDLFWAFLGRLSSYLLLWMLVVEVPILARRMFEAISPADDTPRQRRLLALAVTAPVAAVLVYIWSEGARQLIAGVHQMSNLTVPGGVYTHLFYSGVILAGIIGAFTALAFWIRYLGANAHVSRLEEVSASGGARSVIQQLLGAAVVFLLLAGYVDQAIDAVILVIAVLVSRPLAILVLRATRLAPLLVRIPWTLRFIAGAYVAYLVATAYLERVGISPVSRFGYMVIAIAAALVLIELFVAADEAVVHGGPSRARAVAEGVVVGTLVILAFPVLVAADSGHQEGNALAASASAAAAAAAAAARNRYSQKPKPPNLPDFQKQQQQKQDNSFWSGFSNRFQNIANGFRKYFGK